MRFCTCDFKWNWAGWRKAFTLWNFILTTALGLQKLAIKVGLNGLLPGRQQIRWICVALQQHCSSVPLQMCLYSTMLTSTSGL